MGTCQRPRIRSPPPAITCATARREGPHTAPTPTPADSLLTCRNGPDQRCPPPPHADEQMEMYVVWMWSGPDVASAKHQQEPCGTLMYTPPQLVHFGFFLTCGRLWPFPMESHEPNSISAPLSLGPRPHKSFVKTRALPAPVHASMSAIKPTPT
jgi:hypothetical protein